MQVYSVLQTQPDSNPILIADGCTLQEAEDYCDTINNNLAEAGIPSGVSCAYVL